MGQEGQDQPRFVVVAHAGDPLAVQTLQALIDDKGKTLSRRPRSFEPLGEPNGATRYRGSISLQTTGDNPVVIREETVEVVLSGHPAELPRRTIVVRGAAGPLRTRRFTMASKTIEGTTCQVPLQQELLTGSHQMVVYPQAPSPKGGKGRKGAASTEPKPGHVPVDPQATTAWNAANALAAWLTSEGSWHSDFLSFPGGFEGRSWQLVNSWVEQDRPINAVTSVCLNATKDRRGIVYELAPEIVSLLIRTAKASLTHLSPHISGWKISTFGPGDLEWLGAQGLRQVLLPYMWDQPDDVVRADLTRNLGLVQGLANQLNAALPFPVRAAELHEGCEKIDPLGLISAARERAARMLPPLLADPPQIYHTIEADLQRRNPHLPPSELEALLYEEFQRRLEQEAYLYMLDTLRYGWNPNAGRDQPANLCLGLEVHGGYIQSGRLNEGNNGQFLPIGWFPGCARQHWAAWVLANTALAKERRILNSRLRALGY